MSDTRSSSSRKLVLVDLENLLFGGHERVVESVLDDRSAAILAIAQARRVGDQLVVGCNPRLAFEARTAFPGARLVTRTGENGADAALIDAFDSDHAASRFTELCIVSGDHAFADLAHHARDAGMTIRVVAPKFGLSAALRLQADVAVLLPDSMLEIATDLAA